MPRSVFAVLLVIWVTVVYAVDSSTTPPALLLSSAASAASAATAVPPPHAPHPRLPPGTNTTVVPLTTPALRVLGDSSPRGIFDPSVVATGNATIPYLLAYSAVTATADISTHVAVYDTEASAWLFVGPVNTAQVGITLPCAGGPCVGSFIHEVSSVVVDPTDSPARVWKVFTHSYVVTNDTELHYDWGHIRLFTAPTPSGPWIGEPLLGWRGASSLSTDGVRETLTNLTELADCVLFTEPGAICLHGALIVSLGCVSSIAPNPIRVVAVVSVDHGSTWAYAGVLVDGARDAAPLGYTIPQLNAADLFVVDAALYVSVSPAAQLLPGFSGYAGCLILRVVQTGSAPFSLGVVRDGAGVPVVHHAVVPSDPTFAGACTTAESPLLPAVGGYLLPVLQLTDGLFTILPSRKLPD